MDREVARPSRLVYGAGYKLAPQAVRHAGDRGGFETFSARRVNGRTGKRRALWRGGYYERIIRNETALDRIRAYLANNPAKWSGDTDNITRAAPAERWRF